ncbi:MAG: hypothetical protein JW931_09865 [Methanomicrobiaceae archaeon]|nr:hypothetical protein [Methanomicrobiaceae archaeon]
MIPEKYTAFDLDGNEKRLIFSGKSGGEGAIFNIEGENDLCAKIFFRTKVSGELHEKILTMVNYPPGGNLTKPADEISSSSIAWPSSTLNIFNKGKSEFIGYIMPRIDTGLFKEAHMYYDTTDRLKLLGGSFSWQYLMTAAYNISFVVSKIHETGHCVGDFSPRNILIARTAAVSFIDCDSFQVCNPESRKIYHTKVGTGELLPPELMGRNFRQEEINRHYSDLFALGIIIFRLLMNGAHPYQAAGEGVRDLPTIEQKTMKGLYPYISQNKGYVRPPGYTPPYDIIPSCIRDLFLQCFVEGHRDPFKRPSADEWCRCLTSEIRRLKRCSSNPNHWYGGHLGDCPWCSLFKNSGRELFPYIDAQSDKAGKKIKATDYKVPAKIKTCTICCTPSGFSFRTNTDESIKGRIEVEVTGCREDRLKLEPEAGWIKDISMTGRKGKKRIYEFSIDPSGIMNTQKGVKYKANIILRSSSEIKKVPVELGFRLKPLLATGIQKIILRGINLQKKTEIVFSVINAGEGSLEGKAETDREWLKITPLTFSTGKKQEFRVIIHPEKASKALIHGNITIKTNGGNVKIPLFASAALKPHEN